MDLLSVLHQKLEEYLAVQGDGPMDEPSRLVNESAIVWMQDSLQDLEATLVGLEAAAAAHQPHAGGLTPHAAR